MIVRFVFLLLIILLVNLVFSTMNNIKSPSISSIRRPQFNETFRRLTRQSEQEDSGQKYLSTISLKADNSFQ